MPKKLSTGPELPYDICCGAMASSPDGNGVILFGGKSYSNARYLDVILELKSNGQGWVGSWTTLTAKLQHPRSWHVVIPVFTDKDDACKLIVQFTTTTIWVENFKNF